MPDARGVRYLFGFLLFPISPPVLRRRYPIPLFEILDKPGLVAASYIFDDVGNRRVGFRQQLAGPKKPEGMEQFGKAVPGILLYDRRKIGAAVIEVCSQVLQGDVFVMGKDIFGDFRDFVLLQFFFTGCIQIASVSSGQLYKHRREKKIQQYLFVALPFVMFMDNMLDLQKRYLTPLNFHKLML